MKKQVITLLFFAFWGKGLLAQNTFLSYEKLPTWQVLIGDWQQPAPTVYFADGKQYKGHSDFAAAKYEHTLTFKGFKAAVRQPATRRFMPLTVYDLREMPYKNASNNTAQTAICAVQLVDYDYTDTPAEMVANISRAANLVASHLPKSTTNTAKKATVLIILAKNTTNKLNVSLRKALEQAGFVTATLPELLQYYYAAATKVLTHGTAVGFVKYVRAGEEAAANITPHDIVVYERLPDRVPISNGIITLEPQTPLSHVALLAQNRKTVNIYTNSWAAIPQLQVNKGKLVRLTATTDTPTISAITPQAAADFWAKQATQRVDIPTISTSLHTIIPLQNGDSTLTTVEHIGAKAANYAKMSRILGDAYLKGHAIPFTCYIETINNSTAKAAIAAFLNEKDSLTLEARTIALKKIRKAIKNAVIDTFWLSQIQTLCNTDYAYAKIRLRSSTNCEDLPDFNGAGLYESKGYRYKPQTDSLQSKLLAVFAALWSEPAFAEREFYHIDHRKAAMAILINAAYENEWANGVAVTRTAPNGTVSLYLNVQRGDNLVTNPQPNDRPEVIVFDDITKPDYRGTQTANGGEILGENALYAPLLNTFRQSCLQLHQALAAPKGQYGIDVEFKIMQKDGTFAYFLKQVRLITN
jgi:hypothetical protein